MDSDLSGDTKNQPTHTYRFAVFGHRATGKTVFLASLGAAHRSPSSGAIISYAETLTPPPRPDKSPSADELENERLVNEKRYLEATQAITSQRLPQANDPEWGFPKYRFKLSLPPSEETGFAEGRFCFIEIFDFAGELIGTDTEEKEDSEYLRTLLRDMDGLLVFAEIPKETSNAPEKDYVHIQELNKLSQALNRLISEDENKQLEYGRIALLGVKWDRLSPFDFTASASESKQDRDAREARIEKQQAQKFRHWIDSDPRASGHRSLENEFIHTVGRENLRSFPSSALGRVDPNKPEEVALPGELQSLNIVEPFEFLVNRADALDMRRMEQDTKQLKKWHRRLNFFALLARREVTPSPKDMAPRFDGNPQALGKIAEAKSILQKNISSRFATLSGVIFLLSIGATSIYDGMQIKQLVAAEQTPTDENIEKITPWLSAYASGTYPALRLISNKTFLTPDDADGRLKALRAGQDERYRQILCEGNHRDGEVIATANSYLDNVLSLDNSRANAGVAECAREIREIDKQLMIANDWWMGIKDQVAILESESAKANCNLEATSIDDLNSQLEQLQASGIPQVNVTENLRAYWQDVGMKVASYEGVLDQGEVCRDTLIVQELSESISEDPGELLSNGIPEVVEYLEGYSNTITDQARNIARRYLLGLENTAEQYWNQQMLRSSHWPKTYDVFSSAYHNLTVTHKLKELFQEEYVQALAVLKSYESHTKNRWECAAYKEILPFYNHHDPLNPDPRLADLIDSYGSSPHSKSRKGDLDKMESFLSSLNNQFPLTLYLKSFKAGDNNASSIKYSVYVNGVFMFSGYKGDIKVGAPVTINKQSNLNVSWSSDLSIEVSIDNEEGWVDRRKLYRGSRKVSLGYAKEDMIYIDLTEDTDNDTGYVSIQAFFPKIHKPEVASEECRT